MSISAHFQAVASPAGSEPRLRALPPLWLSAILACLAGLLAACAAPYPAPENAYQGLTLAQYLAATRDIQAFKVSDLYKPPAVVADTPTGLGAFAPGYALLSSGPAILDLAQDATVYQSFPNALAVGLADGDIRVYGAHSCAGMDQPVQGRPRNLAWGTQSRSLAVMGTTPDEVAVYDTEKCHLDQLLQMPRPIVALALSPDGALLAAAGEDGSIWVGPPRGKTKLTAEMKQPLLALGFGPEGGMLFTVTPGGIVTLLNAREGTVLERFQVKGAPFASARFQDHYIVLTTADNRRLAWDLTNRTQVPFSRKLAQFFIDEGLLRYRTWNGALHLTPYSETPRFEVAYSASRGLIRVLDLDGQTRQYDRATGREVPGVCASDWQPLRTNEKGNFCIDKQCYMLTDRAFQWDHDVLLCRSVPGVGWFLWWVKSEQPDQFSPLPDHLPERETLRADEAVEWTPVSPPRDFP
ncbi:MAG: WD40 repeat domain-containing protein [Desulfovibrio sp.]